MKMLKRETEQRQAIEMLCVDMLVPPDHLLRKIDAAVDFTRIYDLVEDLYCEDNGRPSCDPVVLFKLVLIQHLFGIRSLRQTLRNAEVNVAYRWFLGYTMSQRLPHFATVSYAFRNRFTAGTVNLYAQNSMQAVKEKSRYAMEESPKVASRCFMFMCFLFPHWVPATWRRRAQTSIRAELPSGNVPTTRVRLRISRFGRSMTLFVRIRVQCSEGKSQ